MKKQNGPSVTLEISCRNCKYLKSEYDPEYFDHSYYCKHPKAGTDRYLGCDNQRSGYNLQTPEWCPTKKGMILNFCEAMLRA